ncbi:thiaminase;4-amino-5-aminomethyl-2-methylpyrimidine deaminase [Gloeocapsa sp. PCC 7428]|uniref:TenA family protein n=1 Tax=Gloeocapsa sp. PCC 7428 TaxID=1173026 RepID=UPI0002A5E6FA|nr:TenA family protein [Gloeocapsa sp. PCC 7428]AFZ29585.1 thiaminase;4-amino-5-aminomethyl-2-methylpyrimidine deaminase [Gloeocapsa sp. PCC 7428]
MVSAQLWQANQDLAQACLEHPFVQGIGNGTLARHKFAFYVGQDAFFLEAFARAYSIAAAKSPDWEGFSIFHNLANGVLEELRLHESYAAAWGVNLRDVEPQPATRRYTDFLLATAWGSDVGLIAAAMSPCMVLYGFLGQQLAQNGIAEHSYSEWIRTYSGSEFDQLAAQLESLCDRYTSTTPLAQSTYRYAMLCERDFFQAAWEEGVLEKL